MSEERKARFTDREVPIPRTQTARSFFRGIARLAEFGRVFDAREERNTITDATHGVVRDWQRIGGDLQTAIHQAERETNVPAEEARALAASR